MESIARVGARTTPLDPRFGLHGPGAAGGRAPATRMLAPVVRRVARGPASLAPGASMAALTEAVSEFESVGSVSEGVGAVDDSGRVAEPGDPGRNHPTILPDGTVLPAGMTLGHRAMRVKYLKRTLKLALATRGRLLNKYELMGRWLLGLKMALAGARDGLRIAQLNHADPGRIQFLTNKVKQLEAQVGKMERDMHDIRVEVGILNTQIDDMTAELLTFGETV